MRPSPQGREEKTSSIRYVAFSIAFCVSVKTANIDQRQLATTLERQALGSGRSECSELAAAVGEKGQMEQAAARGRGASNRSRSQRRGRTAAIDACWRLQMARLRRIFSNRPASNRTEVSVGR
jgi:hypothetical protein